MALGNLGGPPKESPPPQGQVKLGGAGETYIKQELAKRGLDYDKEEVEVALLTYPQNRSRRQNRILAAVPPEIIKLFQDRFLEQGQKTGESPSDMLDKRDESNYSRAERAETLANFLEVDLGEIEHYSHNIFCDDDGTEYLVLTPEEAWEMAKESLVDSWSDFYCDTKDLLERTKLLRFLDIDAWAEWVLNTDGCGPTLAHYDGEEHNLGRFNIYEIG